MTDKNKLSLIDSMIGNYYEFCSFDDEGMNAGSLQMLIGSIEAVLAHEDDEDEEDDFDDFLTCRHGTDMAACDGNCLRCPQDAAPTEEEEDEDDEDSGEFIDLHLCVPMDGLRGNQDIIADQVGDAFRKFLIQAMEDAES